MAHFIIPEIFDKALDLEVEEEVFIVSESEKPTKIIFARGNKINKNIVHVSKVENWKHKPTKNSLFCREYGVVSAPRELIPNQNTCKKSMWIEDEDGDFLIILR